MFLTVQQFKKPDAHLMLYTMSKTTFQVFLDFNRYR